MCTAKQGKEERSCSFFSLGRISTSFPQIEITSHNLSYGRRCPYSGGSFLENAFFLKVGIYTLL